MLSAAAVFVLALILARSPPDLTPMGTPETGYKNLSTALRSVPHPVELQDDVNKMAQMLDKLDDTESNLVRLLQEEVIHHLARIQYDDDGVKDGFSSNQDSVSPNQDSVSPNESLRLWIEQAIDAIKELKIMSSEFKALEIMTSHRASQSAQAAKNKWTSFVQDASSDARWMPLWREEADSLKLAAELAENSSTVVIQTSQTWHRSDLHSAMYSAFETPARWHRVLNKFHDLLMNCEEFAQYAYIQLGSSGRWTALVPWEFSRACMYEEAWRQRLRAAVSIITERTSSVDQKAWFVW